MKLLLLPFVIVWRAYEMLRDWPRLSPESWRAYLKETGQSK